MTLLRPEFQKMIDNIKRTLCCVSHPSTKLQILAMVAEDFKDELKEYYFTDTEKLSQ